MNMLMFEPNEIESEIIKCRRSIIFAREQSYTLFGKVTDIVWTITAYLP